MSKIRKQKFDGPISYSPTKNAEKSYQKILRDTSLKYVDNTETSTQQKVSRDSTDINLSESSLDNFKKIKEKKKEEKPKKSARQKLKDFGFYKEVVFAIIFGSLTWGSVEIINLKTTNSALEVKVENASKDIDDLKARYGDIKDKDIQKILEEVSFIKGKLSK
jgi:phage shock protein A